MSDVEAGAPAPKPAQTFISEAKSAISNLGSAVKAFFEAHPELETDAANGLRDAADAAAPLAEAAVEEVAPQSLADVIDAAIAKEEQDANAAAGEIAADAAARTQKLHADSSARIEALQAVKPTA